MVFVVLVTPFAFLGVLFSMNLVEQWVERGGQAPPARAVLRHLIPEPRRAPDSYDPVVMGNREPAGQSL